MRKVPSRVVPLARLLFSSNVFLSNGSIFFSSRSSRIPHPGGCLVMSQSFLREGGLFSPSGPCIFFATETRLYGCSGAYRFPLLSSFLEDSDAYPPPEHIFLLLTFLEVTHLSPSHENPVGSSALSLSLDFSHD